MMAGRELAWWRRSRLCVGLEHNPRLLTRRKHRPTPIFGVMAALTALSAMSHRETGVSMSLVRKEGKGGMSNRLAHSTRLSFCELAERARLNPHTNRGKRLFSAGAS